MSGGWAIDLFVGRVTRHHHDVEIGAFHADQRALRDHLHSWTLFRIRDHAWEPWAPGDVVELPDFQLQARSEQWAPDSFDIFLNPLDGDEWASRRHPGLQVPLPDLVLRTPGGSGVPAGVPVLAPEVQLLYKAKYHRPKDEADFAVALPLLDIRRRGWLRRSLETHHPGDPWIPAL